MLGRVCRVFAVCFLFACADTDGIETELKNDPEQGWVRVLSLVSSNAPDVAVTRADEAPVTFVGRPGHLSAWRRQVAGDVSAWPMLDGVPLGESSFALLADAHATVVVMEGDTQPRTFWLAEEPDEDRTAARVRFINALPADSAAASLNGAAMGGVLEASSWSGWYAVTPSDDNIFSVTMSAHAVELEFKNIQVVAGTYVTLALVPDDAGATPRLLVITESTERKPMTTSLLDAEPTT